MKRLKQLFCRHEWHSVVVGHDRKQCHYLIKRHCMKCAKYDRFYADNLGLEVWDELHPADFHGKWSFVVGEPTKGTP